MAQSDGTYRGIAAELAAAIRSGAFAAGAKLPSLRDIAARHDVALITAKRAMEHLSAQGLITAQAGVGYFVPSNGRILRKSPGRLAKENWMGGGAIQDSDTSGRTRTVDVVVGDVPAPEFVAVALGVALETTVLARSRRFLVDGRPVQLATSYLPTELTRGTRIEHTDTGPGGTYARLGEGGHAPERFVERISVRVPTADEVAGLEMSADSGRVFEITRTAYCHDRCVEVNRMVLNAQAYDLEYAFDA